MPNLNFQIKQKIQESILSESKGYETALIPLEDAHLLAQPYALPHLHVHVRIFTLAWRFGEWRECLGQIPRILLAAPASLLGKAPRGNVGTTKMGIFEKKKEL